MAYLVEPGQERPIRVIYTSTSRGIGIVRDTNTACTSTRNHASSFGSIDA